MLSVSFLLEGGEAPRENKDSRSKERIICAFVLATALAMWVTLVQNQRPKDKSDKIENSWCRYSNCAKIIERITIFVTFTGSRSASRTDKRPLSSYRTVPDTYAASPLFVPSTRPSKPVNVVQPVAGGGFWPPPVVFPQRQATTPDPGELNMVSAIFDDFFSFFFFIFSFSFWQLSEDEKSNILPLVYPDVSSEFINFI